MAAIRNSPQLELFTVLQAFDKKQGIQKSRQNLQCFLFCVVFRHVRCLEAVYGGVAPCAALCGQQMSRMTLSEQLMNYDGASGRGTTDNN